MTIPEIDSERFRLRAWRQSDHAPFAGFMASDAARFVGGPLNEADSWRRIAMFAGHWVLRGFGPWSLEEKASGRPAGYAGLWHPHGFPEPEVLYALYDGFRGKGLATEAARRCREHAYGTLGWTTVVSFILPGNDASERVASRLGAVCEGPATFPFNSGAWRHPQVWRHPSPNTSIN